MRDISKLASITVGLLLQHTSYLSKSEAMINIHEPFGYGLRHRYAFVPRWGQSNRKLREWGVAWKGKQRMASRPSQRECVCCQNMDAYAAFLEREQRAHLPSFS